MTDAELDALEAAAKAATPGPWKHYNNKGNDCVTVFGKVFLPRNELSVADTAFIAAANPAAVLELIAELRQARAERDWLAKKISRIALEYNRMLPREIIMTEPCPFYSDSPNCWLKAAKESACPKRGLA